MKDRSRVGTFLARALDVKTDERAWRVGADGEEAIGARLEKLCARGWRVLHSVPVGSGNADIDHVLIGPGGVWTINTKKHPDGDVVVRGQQVRVNGHRTAYVPKARAEAERAGKLLSLAVGTDVEVRAALVFLTGTLFPNVTIRERPEGVDVLDRMNVVSAFKRAPHRLSDDQVDRIYQQARRSTTWTGPPARVSARRQRRVRG